MVKMDSRRLHKEVMVHTHCGCIIHSTDVHDQLTLLNFVFKTTIALWKNNKILIENKSGEIVQFVWY